jgi:P27 family predicted phage terminase small subunit
VPAKRLRPDLKAVRAALDPEPLSLGLDPNTEPPDWLPEVWKAEWRRVMEFSRTRPRWLTAADVEIIAGYCATVAIYRQAIADLSERGLTVPGRGRSDKARGPNGVVRNPSAMLARESGSQMLKFAQQLGFTPQARSSVAIGPAEVPESDLFDV